MITLPSVDYPRSPSFWRGYLQTQGMDLSQHSDAWIEGFVNSFPTHLDEGKACKRGYIAQDKECRTIGQAELKQRLRTGLANVAATGLLKGVSRNEAIAAYNRYGDDFVPAMVARKTMAELSEVDKEDLPRARLENALVGQGLKRVDKQAMTQHLAESLGIEKELNRIEGSRQKRGAKQSLDLPSADAAYQAIKDYLGNDVDAAYLAELRKADKDNFGARYLLNTLNLGEKSTDRLMKAGVAALDGAMLNRLALGARERASRA